MIDATASPVPVPKEYAALPRSAWPGVVKALRARLDLSQQAFGEAVGGVRQATVSDWERGIHAPEGLAVGAIAALAERNRIALSELR